MASDHRPQRRPPPRPASRRAAPGGRARLGAPAHAGRRRGLGVGGHPYSALAPHRRAAGGDPSPRDPGALLCRDLVRARVVARGRRGADLPRAPSALRGARARRPRPRRAPSPAPRPPRPAGPREGGVVRLLVRPRRVRLPRRLRGARDRAGRGQLSHGRARRRGQGAHAARRRVPPASHHEPGSPCRGEEEEHKGGSPGSGKPAHHQAASDGEESSKQDAGSLLPADLPPVELPPVELPVPLPSVQVPPPPPLPQVPDLPPLPSLTS